MSGRLKEFIQQYGKLALYTHVGLSLIFFSGCFLIISYKVVDPEKLMAKLGIDTNSSKVMKTSSDVAIAYIIYKATMPLRISITAVTVPVLAKLLRRR